MLVGRCLPYGEGITYWPLRDVVREAAGDLTLEQIEGLLEGEEDAGRIAACVAGAVGVGEAAAACGRDALGGPTAVRAHSRDRPLVVGFDDLHWAEPTFLDLIEYLAGWSRDAPILLVCLARPELLDKHPTWLTVTPNATSITLEALSEQEAESLLDVLRGEAELSSDILAQHHRGGRGQPALRRADARDDDHGRRAGRRDARFHPRAARRPTRPPRARGARDDRTRLGDRKGLLARSRRRPFARGGPARWSSPLLMTLVRKDLIEPARSIFPWEDGFRFRHVLIRDAAYLAIPKEIARRPARAVRGWLERTAGERANEFEEILGYHLEQAFRYREELGPVGPGGRELGIRAGERLAAAGRRAIVARGDLAAAVSLLSRSAALLPADHPLRRELLPELGSALMRTGDFGRAEGVLTEAMEAAAAAGDRRLELRTIVERQFFRGFTHPEGSVAEIIEVTERTIPELEELGDDLGLAKAWWLKSEVYVNACHWGKRAEALERALEHAHRSGDAAEVATITSQLAQALYYGPTPVAEAVARCEQYLSEHPGNRSLEASVTGVLAGLRAMQGDFEEARRLQARAREIHEELGQRFRIAARSVVGAQIEQLAGRPEEAVAILRWAYETLSEMGATSVMSTMAAFLADALSQAGEHEEAAETSKVSEEQAAATDVVTQVLWRTARARATAAQDPRAAEALAREGLEMARETDYPDLEARALMSVAEVVGPGKEASRLLDDARRLYEAKGTSLPSLVLGSASHRRPKKERRKMEHEDGTWLGISPDGFAAAARTQSKYTKRTTGAHPTSS